MLSFIAAFHGAKAMAQCNYCALTFSDWHRGHSSTARNLARRVSATHVPPYFQVHTLADTETDKNKRTWKYRFIGQGARAIGLSPHLCQILLNTQVSTHWDCFILQVISDMRAKAWKARVDVPELATIAEPSIFDHRPEHARRFRGSGRFAKEAVNGVEEDSYYITLNLSWEWGGWQIAVRQSHS